MKLSKTELDEIGCYIEKIKDLLDQTLIMLNEGTEDIYIEYHQVNPDLILHMYVSEEEAFIKWPLHKILRMFTK